jgi:hypothetical protein
MRFAIPLLYYHFSFSSNPISRRGYLEFCEQDTTWHKKYVVSDVMSVQYYYILYCHINFINSFGAYVGYKKAICTDLQQ